MSPSPSHLAQSVQQRLLNKAKERKEDPNLVLIRYARDTGKQTQWTAFLRRNGLSAAPADLMTVIRDLREFLLPPLRTAFGKRPLPPCGESTRS
jgi:hypothetical protein